MKRFLLILALLSQVACGQFIVGRGGGSVDGTAINPSSTGATTPGTGAFTTLDVADKTRLAFSPADLPGIQLWLDASTVTSAVSTWSDSGPIGNNASFTSSMFTGRLNGRPTVKLTASQTFTTTSSVTWQSGKRGSIFVLYKPTALLTTTIDLIRGTSWALYAHVNPVGPRFYGGSFIYTRSPDTNNTWMVCEITRSADNLTTAYLNKVSPDSAISTGDYTLSPESIYSNAAVDVAEIVVCNQAITGVARDLLYEYLDKKWNWRGNNTRPQIITDGNSLTAPDSTYPAQLAALRPEYDVTNLGISGSPTNTLIIKDRIDIDGVLYAPGRLAKVCVCWEGTNDLVINNPGATAAYNNIVQWCRDRRSAGYKVLVGTILDRDPTNAASFGNTDFAAQRATVNANIVANWATFADGLVDFAANPSLSDRTNTTYFNVDAVHLNDTGYGVVAGIVSNAIGVLEGTTRLTATLASGSAVSLTTATAKTVTSISLPAGDWLLSGVVDFHPDTLTTGSYFQAGFSATTNALGSQDQYVSSPMALAAGLGVDVSLPCPTVRVQPTATTTYYLTCKAGFATSTMTAYGSILAVRK